MLWSSMRYLTDSQQYQEAMNYIMQASTLASEQATCERSLCGSIIVKDN